MLRVLPLSRTAIAYAANLQSSFTNFSIKSHSVSHLGQFSSLPTFQASLPKWSKWLSPRLLLHQSLPFSTAFVPQNAQANPQITIDLPEGDPRSLPDLPTCGSHSNQPLLGVQKKNTGPLAVAISGGVDSAVAAMLLKQEGWVSLASPTVPARLLMSSSLQSCMLWYRPSGDRKIIVSLCIALEQQEGICCIDYSWIVVSSKPHEQGLFSLQCCMLLCCIYSGPKSKKHISGDPVQQE